MRARKPRNGGSRAWGKISKAVAEGKLCWLQLPGCTIQATGADHYYPVKTHPHLEFDPRNHRPACLHCNTARGATPVHRLPGLREKMVRSGKYRPPGKPPALGFFE